MTDKEIEKLATAVAKTVIAAMEKKQQEYDEEFARQMSMNHEMKILPYTWTVDMPEKEKEEVTQSRLKKLDNQRISALSTFSHQGICLSLYDQNQELIH